MLTVNAPQSGYQSRQSRASRALFFGMGLGSCPARDVPEWPSPLGGHGAFFNFKSINGLSSSSAITCLNRAWTVVPLSWTRG